MKKTYRTWTTKDKLAVAKDYKSGTMTIKQVCAKHKCTSAQIYRCIDKLKTNKTSFKKVKQDNKTLLFKIGSLVAELKQLTNEYYKFQRKNIR